jgi:uncharacterized membrane protein
LQDIALLALSPSINDLNTGIEAIVRLGSVITALLVCEPGSPVDRDILRPANTPDFEGFLRSAFDEVRISSSPHPGALQALLRTLARIKDEANRGGHTHAIAPIEQQRWLILAGLESGAIFLEADRDQVRETDRRVFGV